MSVADARGRFVTFEGGEGSGKSTQIQDLAAILRAEGREVVETREPGGSPLGERIRSLLLDPGARMDAATQILLFCAARRDHVVARIEPALKRGAIVLCDRFMDSTRAYQGAAGAIDRSVVETLETLAVGGTRPDLTIVLDIDPALGLVRARGRRGESVAPDAFEASDLAFHQTVRAAFRAIAAAEPERCVVIDAGRSRSEVADEVLGTVRARLALPPPGSAHG
jgi:dTMP kinase